jgi:hypothetical protein
MRQVNTFKQLSSNGCHFIAKIIMYTKITLPKKFKIFLSEQEAMSQNVGTINKERIHVRDSQY